MRDYETLKKEMPGDLEIAKTLFQVQLALKKAKGEKVVESQHENEVEDISSADRLREAISQQGMYNLLNLVLQSSPASFSLQCKFEPLESVSVSDIQFLFPQVFRWFSLTQNGAINVDKWQPMLTSSASCILRLIS